MGTSVNPRRRILSREMSEDENMMIMIKEADAKFNAMKASFAEATDACVKKLEQQQKIEELMEKQGPDQNTQEDFIEKYMDAVESIGHLETEKVLLMYEVERLRDVLEGTEEELAELHWRHAQVAKELETEKVAKYLLLQKVNYMKEQLEERKMSEVIERAATEKRDHGIQSNLEDEEYSGAKRMELKSDDCGKRSMQTLPSSAADLADMEQKQSTNSSYETKHHMQHKTNVPEEITDRKSIERSVNTFTQGTDDIHGEEFTRLTEAGENAPVPENVTHIPQRDTEMSQSNRVMEGRGSQTLESVKFGDSLSNTEDLDTQGHKIVMGGSVQVEGNQTHTDSNTKANNGGKEKGPFDALIQMFTTIMPQQKNLARSERRMSRKANVDGDRSEMHGEREDEVKEQNEEHSRANANHEQYVEKEQKELDSLGDGYEEKDFSEKELFKSMHEPTQPEGDKAPREFTEEAEGIMDDPSDEEMHDAAESMAPELSTTTCIEERKPVTEDDPESTPNNHDMGLGKSLNESESTRQHLKNKDACHVS